MKRTITASILSLTILATGCASQSEVDDLEQRVADLEATAEEPQQNPDTRSLSVVLYTKMKRLGDPFFRCFVPVTSASSTRVDADDFARLEDGNGNIYDRIELGEPKIDDDNDQCEFNFTFLQAPSDIPFYSIRVADHKATWSFTRIDIENQDWSLRLTGTE